MALNVLLHRYPSGGDPPEVYAVYQREFLVGRAADCDLRLPSNVVSRHHCLLRLESAAVSLTDLDSSNGTYLNGDRVQGRVRLRDGDELRMGSSLFVVEVREDDAAEFGAAAAREG